MQSTTDLSTWIQFFKDALIPSQFINTYATKFHENRIRFDMLGDIDRSLLNEMGITAIGDCLSILKHAKLIISKIDDFKKDTSNSNEQTNTNSSKKRCDVAKRIIENYLGDTSDTKLNEKSIQVVKFNEDSLNISKVVVSSTTNDEEQDMTKMNKKIINLKRKLTDNETELLLDNEKPLEYRGLLKNTKKNRTLSLNETIKLNKPIESRLSLSSNSKIIKLNKTNNVSFDDEEKRNIISLNQQKESVFNRIKPVNKEIKNENNAAVKLLKKAVEFKSNNVKPTTTNDQSTKNVTNSKIISLNKTLNRSLSNTKSVHDRLSFK